MPGELDLGGWQCWVAQRQPAGASPTAWRRLCDPDLSGRANPPLAKTVFDALLCDCLERLPSVEAKLALLADAAMVVDATTLPDAARFAAPGSDWARVAGLGLWGLVHFAAQRRDAH